MENFLIFQMEVVGCPTVCMHCWAQGVPYKAMPLDDIRPVLEQARDFADRNGLKLVSWPMHEVAAHPQAIEVLKLFQEIVSPHEKLFDPLPTTGVPLAIRDDWSDLLDDLRDFGITAFVFAFHGVGDVHDRAVNRAGAFEETCLAIRRARAKGFIADANVFVTKENVPQVDELAETMRALDMGTGWWEVTRYSPVTRVRRYHESRPDLDDLLPVATRIAALSPYNGEVWTNLENYTEAAYVSRVLSSDAPSFRNASHDGIRMVCRSNLDLHTGNARLYGARHGNLKADDPARVLESAAAVGPLTNDFLHYATEELPTDAALARSVGNPQGRCIHMDTDSMRYRWLDQALGKLNN